MTHRFKPSCVRFFESLSGESTKSQDCIASTRIFHAPQCNYTSWTVKLNVDAKITRARPTSSHLNPDYGRRRPKLAQPDQASVLSFYTWDGEPERAKEHTLRSSPVSTAAEISRLGDWWLSWTMALTTTSIINTFSSCFLIFFFCLRGCV